MISGDWRNNMRTFFPMGDIFPGGIFFRGGEIFFQGRFLLGGFLPRVQCGTFYLQNWLSMQTTRFSMLVPCSIATWRDQWSWSILWFLWLTVYRWSSRSNRAPGTELSRFVHISLNVGQIDLIITIIRIITIDIATLEIAFERELHSTQNGLILADLFSEVEIRSWHAPAPLLLLRQWTASSGELCMSIRPRPRDMAILSRDIRFSLVTQTTWQSRK
jgi:hypothetical protein